MERRDGSDVTFLIAQINIRDVNDRTPTFTSGTFYINVEENTEIGKEVISFFKAFLSHYQTKSSKIGSRNFPAPDIPQDINKKMWIFHHEK